MEFFKRIQENVDVSSLLKEITDNEEFWLANTNRQKNIKAHRETQTVQIRRAVTREDLDINENQESEWGELSDKYPLACEFMSSFAAISGGQLSRAVIVRLKPKGSVYLHTDHGAYYRIRNRYHLVLKSKEGSMLMSGGEKVVMQEGELWWFDNNQYHLAMNDSEEWRIHFIFDILPNAYAELAKNPVNPHEVAKRFQAING